MTQHEAEAAESSTVPDDLLGGHRRDFLRKAGMTGAALAVWSTPTLLSATAAHAQGTCAQETLDWSNLPGNPPLGSVFTSAATSGPTPVTVTLSTTTLTGTTVTAANRTLVAGPSGGIPGTALFIEQQANGNGVGQDIQFSFSQPVYNLSFTVTDIDNLNNGWSDRLRILTTPFTFAFASPTLLTGNGTGTGNNRFRNTNTNLNLANTDPRGNVTLTWAGPVSSVTMRYQNSTQSGSNQLIRITNLTFNPC